MSLHKKQSGFTRTLSKTKVSGFTLIEIIVSVAIMTVIIGLGLIVSFDFYRDYSFHSEESVIVSVLQKARSESMNNIDQTRHGVHFQASPLQYIIFECPSGTPQCTSYTASASDLIIVSGYNVSVSHPATIPFDVIFDQLSGSCVASLSFNCATDSPITIIEGAKSSDIVINSEGRISW